MATLKLQALWNHPACPKTIHFWAPTLKWGISIANIVDFAKSPEKHSYPQQFVLVPNHEQMRADIGVMNHTMNQFKATMETISAGMPHMAQSNTLSRTGTPTRISAVMPHGEEYNVFPTHDTP